MKQLPLLLAIVLLGLNITSAGECADNERRVARVGYIDPDSRANALWGWPAFWKRMSELGWVEGRNMVVEARFADGRADRLPKLFDEVIQRNVDVIFTYTSAGAVAAKKSTSTIPIVFAGVIDPVGSGVVKSLPQPGGNMTGVSGTWGEGAAGKLLELLHESVPSVSEVAVLSGPGNSTIRSLQRQLQNVGSIKGMRVKSIELEDQEDQDARFKELRRTAQAVLVLPDPFTYKNRRELIRLAAKHHLPDAYPLTENVSLGGLLAFGAHGPLVWRRCAEYVDKILRGSKPSDLPVEVPTTYGLAVNC